MHKLTIPILLITASFGIGFYIGDNNTVSANSVSGHSSITDEDFALYWKALETLESRHPDASSITSKERVWASIMGLAGSYGDPYTSFFNPEETKAFEESINGEFSGVGMEIGMEDGFITVIAPLKDSPAELAGIRAGDVVTAIDQESTLEMTLDEAMQKIRGPKGVPVALTIAREGEGEFITISIVRDIIEIKTVEYGTLEEDSSVFLISLYSFSENVETEFTVAMQAFLASESSKLIIDLRNNPGGYLSSSIDIASWFVPQGKIVVSESFSELSGKEAIVYRSRGKVFSLPQDIKIVVLVDGGSASASEILAGALQEYDLATLIGTKTFGKGSVQEYISLDKETAIKVTVAKWLTPNGNSITEGGLTPDIEVPYNPTTQEDDQLVAAVSLLNQ